ncbi:hypothetical protein NLG97_g6866 [Lecanicillium saksenae]|uniref:Uncharacterized protein n=1 Tax=Lecanicillium saksenae TaxID=468837 RepID=A0ACC1QQ12_9HYPO|nr:hypothetical protein NLG97_g6866 [Lecanicillium saksenae]
MAPFCADPRQIVIALDSQRRIELLKLVDDIIFSMKAQLQSKPDELGSVSMESSIYEESSSAQIGKTNDPPPPYSTIDAKTEASSKSATLFDADEESTSDASAAADGSKKKFNPPNPFKNVKIGVPWKNNPNAPTKSSRRAGEIQAAARKYLEEPSARHDGRPWP